MGYALDCATVVYFEIELGARFEPVGSVDAVAQDEEAAVPLIAKAESSLDEVPTVRFGNVCDELSVKLVDADLWMIATTAAEGDPEVTLTWKGDKAPF